MKIRKAIATTLIAATALVGTASAASADSSGQVYLKIELENVQSADQIFTDGFESGDTAARGPVYYHYELQNVLVPSYG